MKNLGSIPFIISLLAVFVIQQTAVGQFDDLYYDPDNDVYEDSYAYAEDDFYDDYGYDYDDYDHWEDDTYYYSNRIRRFYRPAFGFGYYSPFYTNVYYMDPFAPIDPVYYYDYGSPNIYVSLNFGSPYRYYPYTRGYYSPWGYRSGFSIGYNNWGYNRYASPYYSPFYRGYGGFGGYYGGGYGGFGLASALYCPPGYYGSGTSLYNYGYRNAYVNNQNRVYTSRGYKANGSTGVAGGNRVSPRSSNKAPAYVNDDNKRNAISSARSTRINNSNTRTTRTRIYDSNQRATRIANRTTNTTRINNTRSTGSSRSIITSPNSRRSTGISRGSTRINNTRSINRSNSSTINRSNTRSSNIRSAPTRSSSRSSSSGSRTSSRSNNSRSNN